MRRVFAGATRGNGDSALPQFFDEVRQNGFQLWIDGVRAEMLGKLAIDLGDGLGVFRGCDGPGSARMQRIPRRTLVRARRGGIAVFPQTIENVGLTVPNWTE